MKIKHLSILPIIAVFVLSGFSFAHAQSDVFTQNLYYGLQNNSQVTQLQEFLTSQGLYSGPVTGNYYFLTMNAVKAFQTQQGISPAAGYFGPMTMAAANKIADAEVGASNTQAISETGTSTPPTTGASSTMQLLLESLLQQVAILEQQLQAQQSSAQALQQIAVNTQPQVPVATISANGYPNSVTIPYNTAATINWSSTNANSCNISPSGWSGTSGLQQTASLTASQTYSISCSGAGGSASASVIVNVSAAQPAPTSTPVCTPNWQCGNWNSCANSQQTRTCSDSNNCGVVTGEPPVTQSCSASTPPPSLSISSNPGSLTVLRAQPSQTYGTFAITLSGEPITVQTMNFTITSTNPSPSGDSIGSYPAPVIIGPNGNTIATASSSMNGSTFFNVTNLTFSNVTLSNSGIYKIVGAGWGNSGDTMTLSTNPSTNWSGAVGASGENASLSNTTVNLGTVTFVMPAPAPPVISVDDTLSSLSVNGVAVSNFVSSTLSYNYPLPPGTTATPVVTATTNNANATEVVNQTTGTTGSATVSVTAQNGTTKQTYTINFSVLPRLAVTATQIVGGSAQEMLFPEDLGDITLTANGQGPVTLHSLNITFTDNITSFNPSNLTVDQSGGHMAAFLNPAYGFGLQNSSANITWGDTNNITSPVANGGLAAVSTLGSYSNGAQTVSWVFPNNNLVISPGSPVTLHLWGDTDNISVIYSVAQTIAASIVAPTDVQYYDSQNQTGNIMGLSPNEMPITIFSVLN